MRLWLLISYIGVFLFSKPIVSELERPIYFAPPKLIMYFSFGFQEIYADLLWLRLIQDIDFCSSKKGIPNYDGKKKYQCEKGWSYKVTDTLTELAPRFLRPYEVGGSIMSVIMGDKEGAKRIYDKGVKRFPNEWGLHFGAGYHYLVELKDRERATELFVQSANHGGPQWLYKFAARQYSIKGEYLLAKKVLQDFLKRDKKGSYRKTIQRRLEEIEKKIQNL